MKQKLPSLLKKLFYGSIAGLGLTNTASASGNLPDNTLPLLDANTSEVSSPRKIDVTPKLLLKRSASGEWISMSHTSHRSHSSHSSHSSHRSHYSSSSTGGSIPSTTTPSGVSSGSSGGNGFQTTSPSIQSGSTSPVKVIARDPALEPSYVLGSRVLRKGMKGTDVTELINMLLIKEYLALEDGKDFATGIYLFDETIEEAVKKFQLANNLPGDGVVGPTTLSYLKK